ncbi:MAG: hypothetical protein WDW38_001388 [Sanguina aurantia]
MFFSLLPTWSTSLWSVFLSVLPVWILGAVAGYLVRKREASASGSGASGSGASGSGASGSGGSGKRKLYVTTKDLAFFQYHAEQSGALPGATKWELMMEQDIPKVLKYTAWRRLLPCGKTEYKSTTVAYDASASEFIDVYFDDDFRPNWDGMVVHHEVLENGDFSQRQQVVRWIRRFPFKFLSDREYTIARRMFTREDSLYGITKAITHPRAPHGSRITKVDHFHSMWRSRNVPCPWGSSHSACETLLLHHEQFKIPEHLARFAVRHGMWPFIRTLASVVPAFVEARRLRCGASEADGAAYGSGSPPNPPQITLKRESSHASLSSLGAASASSSDASSSVGSGGCSSGRPTLISPAHRAPLGTEGRQQRTSSVGHLKGMAAVAIVSSLAVLMNRKIAASPQKGAGGSCKRRRPVHVRPVGKRDSLLNL